MFKEPYASLRSEHGFWEDELNMTIEDTSWDSVHLYIHKGTLNIHTLENGYTIKMRWHKTPELLHKFMPTVSDRCWRCQQELGTFLHIWWKCPMIQPYWRKVHNILTAISSFPLEFTLAQYLLHLSKIPSKRYYKSLAVHMINAARLCLPVHW